MADPHRSAKRTGLLAGYVRDVKLVAAPRRDALDRMTAPADDCGAYD